jgi:hypothetical protein
MVVHRDCKSSAVTVLSSAGIEAGKGGNFWASIAAVLASTDAISAVSSCSIVILVSFYLWLEIKL